MQIDFDVRQMQGFIDLFLCQTMFGFAYPDGIQVVTGHAVWVLPWRDYW